MKVGMLAAWALVGLTAWAGALEDGFRSPANGYRPWCHWWWQNGHADEASITADLEAMARLGFGGFMLNDSRGYWDDEGHVVVPKPEIEVMSPA